MFEARKRLMVLVNNSGGRKLDEVVMDAAFSVLNALIEWSSNRGDKEMVSWGQIAHFRVENATKGALDGRSDEQHCSCCGLLRAEAKRLKVALGSLAVDHESESKEVASES